MRGNTAPWRQEVSTCHLFPFPGHFELGVRKCCITRSPPVAVDESRIREWMHQAISQEGIAVCPEAAACVGAIEQLISTNWLKPHERVVIFNTGAAQKYVEAITAHPHTIDLQQPLDWDWIASR